MKQCRSLAVPVLASIMVIAGGLAGCSSPPQEHVPPGSLPIGTAEVSINGTALGTTTDVTCGVVGPVTTISTGDEQSGTTSSVNSTAGLTVQWTKINNLGGFTGSYWADVEPTAAVHMTDRTYLITGSATGFAVDAPSFRKTGTFSIRVGC